MTKYDSIDTDFGTEQTERVTRLAKQQLDEQKCPSCGLWDGTHWHWCPENKRIQFASAGATRKR